MVIINTVMKGSKSFKSVLVVYTNLQTHNCRNNNDGKQTVSSSICLQITFREINDATYTNVFVKAIFIIAYE